MAPRGVRLAVIGVVVVGLLIGLYWVLVPRDYYTGSNSIRTRSFVIDASVRGADTCFPQLKIPRGTGRAQFEIDTGGAERARLVVTSTVGGERARTTLPAGPPGRTKIEVPIPQEPTAEETPGEICIRNAGGGKLFFGGVVGTAPGEVSPTVNGNEVGNRAAIWFLPPAGEQRSIAGALPTLFGRMALFRPGWVGTWTYWLIFLVVTPAMVFAACRLMLRPDGRRVPLAVLVGLLAFGNAAVWAHVTPSWNAPDETEHFAYVQSLAERGKPLERIPTARPPYSSEQALAIRITRIFDDSETIDGKPPWLRSEQDFYETLDRLNRPARDDGGGFAPAGSSHSPLYYSLSLPGYELTKGSSTFTQLGVVRLTSAVLGGVVAAMAVLILLELLPGRRRIAAAAGVAVGFQPMFAFMSGAVNNDMGANAGVAVVTYLLIRLLRRGFSIPLLLGLAVALVLTPLAKATGFAVYPAALGAVVLALWRYRDRWRRTLPALGIGLVACFGLWQVWYRVAASFDRGTFGTPTGGAPGQGFPAFQEPGGALVYFWEAFLPRLPFMSEHWSQSWPAFDVFGIRGWGAFGWYAISWRYRVYWIIMVAIVALTVLGLVALWRRRDWFRDRLPETLVLLAVVFGVLAVMLGAYYSPVPQGASFPQQGRYFFPAIGAMAALLIGSALSIGPKWGERVALGAATAVVMLGAASMWLVLGGFYFAYPWSQ